MRDQHEINLLKENDSEDFEASEAALLAAAEQAMEYRSEALQWEARAMHDEAAAEMWEARARGNADMLRSRLWTYQWHAARCEAVLAEEGMRTRHEEAAASVTPLRHVHPSHYMALQFGCASDESPSQTSQNQTSDESCLKIMHLHHSHVCVHV